MEVDRTNPVLRARLNMQPRVKQVTPVSTKKSVSVAAIFQKQAQKAAKGSTTPQSAVSVPKSALKDASNEKAQSLKSRSSSRSPHKVGWKVSKKRSDVHPLAVAFKETSDDYRRHLYRTATLKINQTLEALLHNLYENTLQTVSSDADNSQEEPLRLTVPAKFERAAQKLYLPISAYNVRLTRTNTNGERDYLVRTLETRMHDFEEHLAEQTAEIERLRKNWETLVGEIWKVGVHCLGEDIMKSMLLTNKDGYVLSSCPSKVTEPASTLFVPEHGTSPAPRKKRVTFETPTIANDDLPNTETVSFDFLYQPTRLRLEPLPAVPALPEKAIEDLSVQVKELGSKQLEDYRKVERENHAHWQKKTAQLMNVLKD
ncbi:hypothetical protein CC86DRAFT_339643 [Ophiobolus disseminans]|uniref:Uncharacterized protein n=1 Tax=Ophiobolus disseminans TaxID=1469910 RepID=A0A6A7ALD2_9PLEO|nr:hypothetical protein CC86DRAFT_339643 [Ophiobolus disseminans]